MSSEILIFNLRISESLYYENYPLRDLDQNVINFNFLY